MRNFLKAIFSYVNFFFIKLFYPLLFEHSGKEAIYTTDDKFCVVVKDEEVSKRLYELIKLFKVQAKSESSKSKWYHKFNLKEYGLSFRNGVKWFADGGFFVDIWYNQSKQKKLKHVIEYVEEMQEAGFVLDNNIFDVSKCDNISEFLSFFIQSTDSEKIKQSKGCLINYIHYVLSEEDNLNEFYESLIKDKVFCERKEFPYSLPIANLCYKYFKNGETPYDILNATFKEDKYFRFKGKLLIAFSDEFDSFYNVTEENDEYTVYDNNMKIYKQMPSGYENFFRNERYELLKYSNSLELVDAVIVDFDDHVLGYQFIKESKEEYKKISDILFQSQFQIFHFMKSLINMLSLEHMKPYYTSFDVEEQILCKVFYSGSSSEPDFILKWGNVKALFNFISADAESINEQIITIFFKIFNTFIKEKYGGLSSRYQFMQKSEIRFLNPTLAKEFVKYARGEKVNYKAAYEALIYFWDYSHICYDDDFLYDSRFDYNPLKTIFTFESEAREKYNVELKNGTSQRLSDGRMVITFKRSKPISKFKESEGRIREEIKESIGNHIEDENVKFLKVSEIIIDGDRLNSEGMYNVSGYITEAFEGERLTNDFLLTLNNKDLLKVFGYYLSKYRYRYIYSENIWMSNDFHFYIDTHDESLIIRSKSKNFVRTDSSFVEWVIAYLKEIGYNPFAFYDLSFKSQYNPDSLKEYLINLAEGYDAYCDEHSIYYCSKDSCPVCSKIKFYVPQKVVEEFTKVYEDSIAVHYNIDENYNLKIYKPGLENLSAIEANVSKIVKEVVFSGKVNLYQDCFIPCKKALDSNGKFIGLVYKKEKFEAHNGDDKDFCIELKDTENLKNLPRVKSLDRLVSQTEEILKNHSFIGNPFMVKPFSGVFLNASHKKQVQIVNIEFLNIDVVSKDSENLSDGDKQTIRSMILYIQGVYACDDTLKYIRNKTFLWIPVWSWEDMCRVKPGFEWVKLVLQNHTPQDPKYCPIHKMYYTSEYVCCPKCVDLGKYSDYVQSADKSFYEAKNPFGEGGESFIYSYNEEMVLKMFKEGLVNTEFKCRVLFKILEKREILEETNSKKLKYRYVFPRKILSDQASGKIFGYVMEKIENAHPISILKDKVEVQKLGFSMKDIFEIIITIGEGIENLHKAANIYIGDLNGQNILFDTQKNVYFIDFDGMGVDEIAPEFCTDGYIDPESKKNQNITMKDDWYSFAIQAFYYLTYTHPFSGIYYAEENGKKVLIEENSDKMERKISLLGNHGMRVPQIAKPWNWMRPNLKNAFLNTFEGELRESIVPYLKEHYEVLFSNSESQVEDIGNIYRINDKFIAIKFNRFDGHVMKTINSNVAICMFNGTCYISVLIREGEKTVQKNFSYYDFRNVDDVLISKDEKLAFIIYKSTNLFIMDLEKLQTIYKEEMLDSVSMVVRGRTVYFDDNTLGYPLILKRTVLSNYEVKKESIKVGGQIKSFDVMSDSKFVFVEESDQYSDKVYCNNELFSVVNHASVGPCNYNVICDRATKSWLVANDINGGFIIKDDGTSEDLEIAEHINDVNLNNIVFENGIIYIPNQDYLCIINTMSKVVKKMECNNIMTSESEIFDINSKGFSVLTDGNFYEVRKG